MKIRQLTPQQLDIEQFLFKVWDRALAFSFIAGHTRQKEKELRRNIENNSKTVCFQRTNSVYTENPEKSLELAELICKYSKVVDMSPGNLDSSL